MPRIHSITVMTYDPHFSFYMYNKNWGCHCNSSSFYDITWSLCSNKVFGRDSIVFHLCHCQITRSSCHFYKVSSFVSVSQTLFNISGRSGCGRHISHLNKAPHPFLCLHLTFENHTFIPPPFCTFQTDRCFTMCRCS